MSHQYILCIKALQPFFLWFRNTFLTNNFLNNPQDQSIFKFTSWCWNRRLSFIDPYILTRSLINITIDHKLVGCKTSTHRWPKTIESHDPTSNIHLPVLLAFSNSLSYHPCLYLLVTETWLLNLFMFLLEVNIIIQIKLVRTIHCIYRKALPS